MILDNGARTERYPILWDTFKESPILGCYFQSDKTGYGYKALGGHLHWMNKLTVTGIIGFLLFIIIPVSFIRKNMRYYNQEYKFYYLLSSLSILAYGFLKAIAGFETWDAEKQRYELKPIGTQGVFAYSLKPEHENGEPPHWICPDCYQDRKKSILQTVIKTPGMARVAICQRCKFSTYTSGIWQKEHK